MTAVDPSPITDPLADYPIVSLLLIMGAAILGLLVGWFIVRQIAAYFSDAATGDPPATLILTLSFITLVAVVGALLTEDESAWTLAATGVGALAASLTTWFQNHKELQRAAEEARSSRARPEPEPEAWGGTDEPGDPGRRGDTDGAV